MKKYPNMKPGQPCEVWEGGEAERRLMYFMGYDVAGEYPMFCSFAKQDGAWIICYTNEYKPIGIPQEDFEAEYKKNYAHRCPAGPSMLNQVKLCLEHAEAGRFEPGKEEVCKKCWSDYMGVVVKK